MKRFQLLWTTFPLRNVIIFIVAHNFFKNGLILIKDQNVQNFELFQCGILFGLILRTCTVTRSKTVCSLIWERYERDECHSVAIYHVGRHHLCVPSWAAWTSVLWFMQQEVLCIWHLTWSCLTSSAAFIFHCISCHFHCTSETILQIDFNKHLNNWWLAFSSEKEPQAHSVTWWWKLEWLEETPSCHTVLNQVLYQPRWET